MNQQDFSSQFPKGTPVRYYPIAGEAEFENTVIRSGAWTLGNGAVVVKIQGHRGGVSIDHIKPFEKIEVEIVPILGQDQTALLGYDKPLTDLDNANIENVFQRVSKLFGPKQTYIISKLMMENLRLVKEIAKYRSALKLSPIGNNKDFEDRTNKIEQAVNGGLFLVAFHLSLYENNRYSNEDNYLRGLLGLPPMRTYGKGGK